MLILFFLTTGIYFLIVYRRKKDFWAGAAFWLMGVVFFCTFFSSLNNHSFVETHRANLIIVNDPMYDNENFMLILGSAGNKSYYYFVTEAGHKYVLNKINAGDAWEVISSDKPPLAVTYKRLPITRFARIALWPFFLPGGKKYKFYLPYDYKMLVFKFSMFKPPIL